MRYTILALTVALCLALVSSNPLPENGLHSEDANPESENRVNEETAESQNNSVQVHFADETPNDKEELAPLNDNETENNDEERDKRQGANTGTGSPGNFIFDIIRTVASSGSNSGGSGGANWWGSSEEKPIIGPTQGMTMAIPGPWTRLLLIANRGWADMIADVVLRLAAVSEKFVNYKAKLITWLI
ncbi:uncharacterized protein LOC114942647 isoform X2 [Nylanderia fulva]|uniref:uncharacterized protein LOC114942647 isoform X2 n=1 Tax=Nylanderia fulva TaxID=613905 RepID=UPI0010FB95C2|nr:uncharacterized protein LOC114942647 isoform X2 [Nylanderia fulva]